MASGHLNLKYIKEYPLASSLPAAIFHGPIMASTAMKQLRYIYLIFKEVLIDNCNPNESSPYIADYLPGGHCHIVRHNSRLDDGRAFRYPEFPTPPCWTFCRPWMLWHPPGECPSVCFTELKKYLNLFSKICNFPSVSPFCLSGGLVCS